MKKYYFEDYNYLLNQKNDFKYPFAPGYVQYTKNFLNKYEKIRNEELEDKVYNSLMEFLIDAMPKIRRRSLRLCSGCGYNHETRDLIRATLLHLIDGLETNRRFIKFIEDDVHEDTYKQLVAMSEVETSKPTEVIKHSINDHQTKGYLLLKKKRALDEESPSYLLGARPPSTDAVKEGMRTILITGSGILKVLLHGEISDIIYNENEVCRVYPDAKDGAALIYFKDYKIYNPPKIIKDEIVMRLMTEFKYNTRDSLYFINEEMFDQLI